MLMFFHTLTNLLLPIFVLIAAGLTAILWLLPFKQFRFGFFIAPVIGITIFSSIGLFEISVLLTNFSPVIISMIISVAFLLTLLFKKRSLLIVLHGIKKYKVFFILPAALLLLISFSSLKDGLNFLSAGQDEIQYVNNAAHILKHQHTNDPLDTLAPRFDHFPRDAVTLELSYKRTYRRGAEILLAGVMGLTSDDPFVSFTTTGIIAYLCFLLVIPAISMAYLGLNLSYALFIQFVFSISNLWIMLLFQGSLAHLFSISLFFLALTATPQLINTGKYKHGFLAGILFSGPIIFYNEVAPLIVLAPLAIVMTITAFNNISSRKNILCNTFISIVSVKIFSHAAIYGLLWNFWLIFDKVISNKIITEQPFTLNISKMIAPVYGVFTYYSTTFTNNSLAQFTDDKPLTILLFYLFIQIVAIWGFVKCKKLSSFTLGTALIVSLFAIMTASISRDNFTLMRALQYNFNYAILGLLVSLSMIKIKQLKIFFLAVIFSLISINILTLWSTLNHLFKYDVSSDPIIFRYSPNSTQWSKFFKRIANVNPESPILITGYTGTAKPLLLASIIEPRPNYMGESIRKFWQIMALSPPVYSTGSKDNPAFIKFLHYIFEDRFYDARESIKFQPNGYMDIDNKIIEMDRQSKLAVIMIGSNDPEEWGNSRLISLYRDRYSGIADIVERFVHSPIQLEVDGYDIPSTSNSPNFVKKSFKVFLNANSNSSDRELELILDTSFNLKNIIIKDPLPSNKISLNGKVISIRLPNEQKIIEFSIKTSAGLSLKNVRLVDIN